MSGPHAARPPLTTGKPGVAFLTAFASVAVGIGAARAMTTSFLPVLLERADRSPELIGVLMLVNPIAGFAIPLAVGLWSDRAAGARSGRRAPFVVGGSLLTAGGLLAVGFGTATSYLVLVLAGAMAYVGLNATATAHRAMVAEDFDDSARPGATSAQELAMIVGGLFGVVAGGALIGSSVVALFAAGALLIPVLALPTLTAVSRRAPAATAPASNLAAPSARELLDVMRRSEPRAVILAQILWVAAYAALPAFFILYAADVLHLGAGVASLALASLGLATGAGMLLAARARPEQVYPMLLLGAALLGGGLLAAAPFGSLAAVAPAFAAAAFGFGLLSSLGFTFFARFIPAGRQGSYSGAYFSSRAIASTIALPLAGVLVGLTGSYRALLFPGAAALAALIPLAFVRPRRSAEAPRRVPVRRLGAVIPCYGSAGLAAVVDGTLRHADEVVLVDDGSSAADAAEIARVGERDRVRVLRLESNQGKGTSVAHGARFLAEAAEPPDGILVLDCDGQHRPEDIPEFVRAAERADVVIGNRSDRAAMPWLRRFTNRASSVLLSLVLRRRIVDSQCGMRLLRADALDLAPLPDGGYEAETRHLKELVRAGAELDWVEIPALYGTATSSFRALPDGLRVLAAIIRTRRETKAHAAGPPIDSRPETSREFARVWSLRLAALLAATLALAASIPLLAGLDQRLFLAINALGEGPEWIYRAFDPHTRNYVLLTAVAIAAAILTGRRALGVGLTVVGAAFFSDLLLEVVQLFVDRPRPEEVLGSDAALVAERSWAGLPSFPSGHLVVTTAMAVAAMGALPALRRPLWIYVAVIALTRVTFGAHFPLDVAAGILVGYEVGAFVVALARRHGLLSQSDGDSLATDRSVPDGPCPEPAFERAPA